MPAWPAPESSAAAGPAFAAVVFDFDGTLVRSAAAKREAFFGLFPTSPAHAGVVARILAENPDGTRFTLIPQMLAAMAAAGLAVPGGAAADDLVAAYGQEVLATVMAAPEMPGATALLRKLAGRCHVSICSSTPHEPLQALAAARGWNRLVAGIFGLPTTKAAHIAAVMAAHRLGPHEVAMVGDGDNDAAAARANGCAFFRVAEADDLGLIAAKLGAGDVQG